MKSRENATSLRFDISQIHSRRKLVEMGRLYMSKLLFVYSLILFLLRFLHRIRNKSSPTKVNILPLDVDLVFTEDVGFCNWLVAVATPHVLS